MIIIKLGGSVITNKSKECNFNSNAVSLLLSEVKRFLEKKENRNLKFILVHGAGSFGHINAKKYQIQNGYINNDQIPGISKVHRDVRDLNLMMLKNLLSFGISCISLPPMAIMRNENKLLVNIEFEVFRRVLELNCIPITYGDIVFDESLKFSICSGDSIIHKLAQEFKPVKVIFATDVDGLHTSNPILDSNAQLISHLDSESFSSACTTQNVNPDVTGGIFLKATIALALAQSGIETHIINGTKEGRLYSALCGEDVIGTIAK